MRYNFALGFHWIAFDSATNAFQTSFDNVARESPFLQARGFRQRTTHGTEQFSCAPIDSKRLASRPWTKRFSSLVEEPNFESNDRVAADEDEEADEDEDARFQNEVEIENFFREAERDANRMNFPKGKPEGYYVTSQYFVPHAGFENLVTANSDGANSRGERAKGITQEEVDRLGISGTNITLPIALMLLDGETYPSLSRARKSCR